MTQKYEVPTMSFPYKITRRLALMALPRRQVSDYGDWGPKCSPTGVRQSALKENMHINDRVNECAWPYVRRLVFLRQMYKDKFSRERLERLDRMIAMSNATIYTKFANCAVVIRKTVGDDMVKASKKRKPWGESDWRKHMEYISQIAKPRKVFQPVPLERGPIKPIEELLPRADLLAQMPQFKVYKRLSQDDWYKDPSKVAPLALKYVITERVKKLAEPRALKQE